MPSAVYFLSGKRGKKRGRRERERERERKRTLYHEEYNDLWNLEQPLPGFIEKPL